MSLDVYLVEVQPCDVFEANITHNLAEMADMAGIYKPLWRPEEIGIQRAKELIEPLEKGLATLKEEPEKFRQWNPDNGWGSYEGLIDFVEKYLEACREHPDSLIRVSR